MKMNKIFIDENIPLLAESLKDCAEVTSFHGRKLCNKDLLNGKCEALIVRSTTKVNRTLLEGTEIKLVGTATSGIDHIDLDYLNERNIEFAYAPGSNANSVAEYVVYSILKWAEISCNSLENKTIGIIGYGNIGKIVAKYAGYMGLRVLVNDPPLLDNSFIFPENIEYASLEYLFQNSDIVTNHVPLNSSGIYKTIGLINESHINSFKQNSLTILASRGSVVTEEPLLLRLRKKELFAAIDVWENEPFVNSELANLTILATPHIAGYSRDGKLRGTLAMIRAFEIFSGCRADLSFINNELDSYLPIDKCKFKDFNLLYEVLRRNRQFEYDNRLFLNTLEAPIDEQKKLFDSLRKNYPVRREAL